MLTVQRRPVLIALSALMLAAGCSRPPASQPAPEPAPAPASTTLPTPPPPALPPPLPPPPPELPGTLLVMVENSADARPQAGLDKADVVYEIEAEGGITRFLAAFYQHRAEKIGPVRSARMYFINIARAYGSLYAHAGANADALDLLSRDHSIANVDEIYGSGAYFWRSKDREAPHNLYTSTDLLLKAVAARSYPTPPLTGWTGGELPAATGNSSPLTDITLTFLKTETVVGWHWDGGHYQRLINGTPHRVEDGTQLQADNVVVVLTDVQVVHRPPDWELDVRVTGEGDALFLRNGKVWHGRWHKDSPRDQFRFTVGEDPFPFRPGTTWVEVIPADRVQYGGVAAG